jgi:outer membrane protein OmpA-like peptidoglycan-associated protein
VRSYLIRRGVAAERLVAKSYSRTRPVDARHNADAWSRNRRVEFVILRRAE